jgi:hypothetical protein
LGSEYQTALINVRLGAHVFRTSHRRKMNEHAMTDRAIASTYRAVRQQGGTGLPAYKAALAVVRERHPETPDNEAKEHVSHVIADASQRFPEWFWDGVGAGPVKKWWEH